MEDWRLMIPSLFLGQSWSAPWWCWRPEVEAGCAAGWRFQELGSNGCFQKAKGSLVVGVCITPTEGVWGWNWSSLPLVAVATSLVPVVGAGS